MLSIAALASSGAVSAATSTGACPAKTAAKVELVMVEDHACAYCARWNREVGGGYAASDEGRFAPLTRITAASKRLKTFAPITYTPTFIVVRDDKEIGRVTGYPGADFFWPMLAGELAKAGFKPGMAETASTKACPETGNIR